MKKNNFLFSLIKLATISTTAIYGFNKFIDYCCSKNNSLNSGDGNYYSWKYGKIFYTVQGSGEPLLLIHDLSHYACGKEWEQVLSSLAENHTVYVIDLLGCGRSHKPAITYTSYLYAQMIADFVNNVIHQPVDIIISGEACPIAITTVANNPSVLKKIIFVNPPSVEDSDIVPNSNTRIVKGIIEFPIIGTFIYNILNSRTNCFNKSIEDYFSKDDYISYTYSHTMYDACHKNGCGSKYVMASVIGLYTKLFTRRLLTSISNELYIIGGNNEIAIDETISSYCMVKPDIVSDIVEFSKHFPHIENPKDFTSLINNYPGH